MTTLDPNAPTFYVKAEVWGGVTGYRSSFLKKDGKTQMFETREGAQAAADEARARTLGGGANFAYTVVEVAP